MPKSRVEVLADRAAHLRRAYNLAMPGAVWGVLRAQGLADGVGAKELASDILSELQKRSTARRKKNREKGRSSPKFPEQLDFKLFRYQEDAINMVTERGGDPDD